MVHTTRFSRRISPGLRRTIYFRADSKCQWCEKPIEFEKFHISHLRAHSHGGPSIEDNLQAWCVTCNREQGNFDVFDTRTPLRPWQREALPDVIDALTLRHMATVMAAPGAGKTVFAGAVFAFGQDAGLWQRMLVLVPRLPLVKQWEAALRDNCHIALDTDDGARQSGRELNRMDGVCLTYQGLLPVGVRQRHQQAVEGTSTLVVLDEVHHLGQRVEEGGDPGEWSKAVRDVVGDIRTGLNVAGVLNLSGTLFRTSKKEQISTVDYMEVETDRGPRIECVTNYAIHPERLVREGILRAPDLYRVGANVDIVDLKTAEVKTSAIADLVDDDAATRLALRSLNLNVDWMERLVTVTLDQLQRRHFDADRAFFKALIVARRQEEARMFAAEVNRQMVSRGLPPLAECVVSSDGSDAYTRLEQFRLQRKVGVLCTVGMAGEGFDCPEIIVVTYATNVQTAQYIRQVVARGQRVTAMERERRRLPMAVILPDIRDLVEQFTGILAPMVHEIEPAEPGATAPPPREGGGNGTAGPGWQDLELVGVRDAVLEIVSPVNEDGSVDVNPALERLLVPMLHAANLPGSDWARVAHVIAQLNQHRPFEAAVSFGNVPIAPPARSDPSSRQMTPREHTDAMRKILTTARGWWAEMVMKRKGGQPVALFTNEVHTEAGIGKIENASPEQLERALNAATRRVRKFCQDTATPLPRWAALKTPDNP